MASLLRLLRLPLISAFAFGSLTAGAQNQPSAAAEDLAHAAAATPEYLSPAALNAELFYALLVSEISASQGDFANAVPLMLEAARESASEDLYRRATEMALRSRSGQRALMATREWLGNFPQSREANRYLLQTLLMLNRISETPEYLLREVQSTPASAKPALYMTLAQLYGRASDKVMAAAVVEQVLQEDLKQPELAPLVWSTIGHLRLRAQQTALAFQALRHAYDLDPSNGATALLALEMLESGHAQAEPMVKTYVAGEPAPAIQLAYARLLLRLQRPQEALLQIDALLDQHPQTPDAWMLKASVLAEQSQWDGAQRALQSLHKLLASLPASVATAEAQNEAYLLGARVALQQKRPQQALEQLQRITDGEQDLEVQSLKALALSRQGKLAQGRALIRAFDSSTPEEELQKRRAEVQLLRESNAPQEAYLLQLTLHEQQPENNDIAYETALLAERAGKLDAMERLLRGIIERDPKHHHALNALGYSLADRNLHLQEARSLIERAIELQPNDAFITDSLGWVEFRLGNREKALEILEAAYAMRDDVEIAAHLGEVLWSLNQRERARSIWRAALQRDAENATLQETLKRLKVKP